MSKFRATKRRVSNFYLGDPKVKAIIIGAASLILILMSVFLYHAIMSGEENRLAALKYNFNDYYDNFLSHTVSDSSFDKFNSLSAKINAAKMDSDGDGLTDVIEIAAGLDFNSEKSDHVKSDSERVFTRYIDFGEGEVCIDGDANIYGCTVDKLSLNTVRSNIGVLSSPYEVYCPDGFTSAKIIFKYDRSRLDMLRINADSLHIYKFDPYGKTYKDIGGDVSFASESVESVITDNGVYVLGSDGIIEKSTETYAAEHTNVHLIIDNSGSLYKSTDTYDSEENDVDFKRLAFAKKFVSEFEDNARFAISVFTYDFKTLCDFDNNKSHVIDTIESIRTLGAGFDGTSVERAMVMGLDYFDDSMKDDRNIIVILTDGISTNAAGYTIGSILTRAHTKNVSVMTISLGDIYDRELLETIADNTGGKYYSISESSLLENLHLVIVNSMMDNIIDEDNDGKLDSYMMYDTGFDIDTNGYSFKAFQSEGSDISDFGMVLLARDWFRNSFYDEAYAINNDVIDFSEPLHKHFLKSLGTWTNPDTYLNFNSTGDTLCIKSDIKTDALSKGWKVLTLPYEEPAVGWKYVEILTPDSSSDVIKSTYGSTDSILLKLIAYYDSRINDYAFYDISDDASLDKLKLSLSDASPFVLRVAWSDGEQYRGRYVLLTSMRRDLDNPCMFRLKVYDVVSDRMETIVLSRNQVMDGNDVQYVYMGNWDGKDVVLQGCAC